MAVILIGVNEGCRYCGQEYEVELDGEARRLTARRPSPLRMAGSTDRGAASATASIDDGRSMRLWSRTIGVARFWQPASPRHAVAHRA